VVPVKGFGRAKGRLAPILDPTERADWARSTLDHVLDVLDQVALPVLVVTDAPEVVRHVEARRAEAVLSPVAIGEAARLGVARVAERGAEAVLVCMGDLPLLSRSDLRAVVARSEPVVICPDRVEAGTNGLYLRPAAPTGVCFGHVDSFERHRAAHPGAAIVRSRGWGHDVDTPADLERIRSLGSGA